MAFFDSMEGLTPRVRNEAQWLTSLSQVDARRRVEELARAWEMRPAPAGPSELCFDQGSQVRTRALGAWLGDPKHFPKRTIVVLNSVDEETSVAAVVYETLGFAIFDSVTKRRYQEYFTAWMDSLKRMLPSARVARSASIEKLEQLALLHSKGIITDNEFRARKAKLLQ